MMFGKDTNSMRLLLLDCSKSGDYSLLLDLYWPYEARALQSLREKQIKNNGGIV